VSILSLTVIGTIRLADQDIIRKVTAEHRLPNVSIEQVWFAGAHADVGGGYKTRSLAHIPLVWMAKQAEAVGLTFDWT
jgi:hypothetical protein